MLSRHISSYLIKGGDLLNDIVLSIDEGVLKKTVKCRSAFSCLSGDKNRSCDVIDSISSDMVRIALQSDKVCSYRLSYGYSYYCLCPTRCAIYKRYKM